MFEKGRGNQIPSGKTWWILTIHCYGINLNNLCLLCSGREKKSEEKQKRCLWEIAGKTKWVCSFPPFVSLHNAMTFKSICTTCRHRTIAPWFMYSRMSRSHYKPFLESRNLQLSLFSLITSQRLCCVKCFQLIATMNVCEFVFSPRIINFYAFKM